MKIVDVMMFNPKSAFFFGLAFILFLAQPAMSWSGSVHTQIGVRVYELLDKKERSYYKKLAKRIDGTKLQFQDLSSWVDSIRGEPVYELFETEVPAALSVFSRRHTSNWHYENAFYDGGVKVHGVVKPHACHMQSNGRLEAAMLAVDEALQESLSKKQEAILVAFAMHLLEDIHQPFHTTALVREDCSHDRGGNLYCLKKMAGKCVMNLHALWDQAFSVARDASFMQSIRLQKAQNLPLQTVLQLLLFKGHELAKKAYDTKENSIPHKEYIDWAKDVTRTQISETVNVVAHYLKMHHARRTQK